MLLPIGMDGRRSTRWPVATLTLAVLTLGISGSVAWHNHLTRNGTWFDNANAYWHDHPDLPPADACAAYLTPPPAFDPSVPRPPGEPGDTRKFATLCLEALNERTANQPMWLVRPGKGMVQLGLLTHGLAFPNMPSALIGLLLLVLVLGSSLEQRWGRDRFALFWALSSVVTAVVYTKAALAGAEPLAGGNAASAACLGAFVVIFAKQRFSFAISATRGASPFAIPAWSVAILWLVAHVAVIALSDGRTPADSTAELAGFAVGIAVGLLARFQNWQAEPRAEVPKGPEPTWVQSAIAPQQPQDARQTQPSDGAHAGHQPPAPMFGDAPPDTHAGPPVARDDSPRFDDFPLFGDLPPAHAAPMPEAVPLETNGGWARFASDEPVLPTMAATAAELLHLAPLSVATPAPLHPTSAAFADVLNAMAPEPRSEPTLSFSPTRVERPAEPSTTPYWTLLGRDNQGLLLHDEDGVPTRLNPRHLLAVAVGVVQQVDAGAPGPALIFDLVMDLRPPRCVRLRPTPDVLAAGWPGLTRQEAVVALARELASGGALRIPQVPEWPGPPWSAFPDTRSLMAAWQQALRKR